MEFPAGLLDQLMPPSGTRLTAEVVGARLEHLALMAGLPIPRDRLASLERQEVQRFIASIFDLALDARLFVSPADLPYLLDEPPADWSEEDLQLAAYLMKSGLLAGDLNEPLTAAEIDETLYRLAIYLRVVEMIEARYLGLEGDSFRFDWPRKMPRMSSVIGWRPFASLVRAQSARRWRCWLETGWSSTFTTTS